MGALISVIVPVYKVEAYLDRCVSSIAGQSYQNLEILLVDDGSPDRCGQMCDAWAAKDSRIRVIHKPNGGLSDARNCGVCNANGEYVVFVDSDDYIEPKMIETLYQSALHANTRLAICNVNCVNEDGISTGESEDSPMKDEVLSADTVLERFYQSNGWLYIVAWNRLYHRSLLSNETFPIGKWHEDEFVAAQLVWVAEKVACVSYLGYNYVTKRKGSIMQSVEDPRRLDALEALIVRYRFYQEIGKTELLHETRARILCALEKYYWAEKSRDLQYDRRMNALRTEYGKLTGFPLKEWLKWKLFQISPKLEHWFVNIGK